MIVGEGVWSVGDGVEDDWRPAEMGDFVTGDGVEDRFGLDCAENDVCAGDGGDSPGEAPAVAVEHGECPQVDRVRVHVPPLGYY